MKWRNDFSRDSKLKMSQFRLSSMRQVNFEMPQILNKYLISTFYHSLFYQHSERPVAVRWRMIAMMAYNNSTRAKLFAQRSTREMIEIFWNRKLTRESKHFFYHSIKANCWKAFCFVVSFQTRNTFSLEVKQKKPQLIVIRVRFSLFNFVFFVRLCSIIKFCARL
jgi:hypothetical protein